MMNLIDMLQANRLRSQMVPSHPKARAIDHFLCRDFVNPLQDAHSRKSSLWPWPKWGCFGCSWAAARRLCSVVEDAINLPDGASRRGVPDRQGRPVPFLLVHPSGIEGLIFWLQRLCYPA